MNQFSLKLNSVAQDTNTYLKKIFSKKNKFSYLIKPMQYSILSGGKRFRSVIIVNTGKIFDIDYKKLIMIGAAIECVHSYSLIHDDLPAMDNDDLRRGKLSNHKKFNEHIIEIGGGAEPHIKYMDTKNIKTYTIVDDKFFKVLQTTRDPSYDGFTLFDISDLYYGERILPGSLHPNATAILISKLIHAFANCNPTCLAAQTNITSLGTLTGLTTSGTIELGHASDTTIARSASGTVTIEGEEIEEA